MTAAVGAAGSARRRSDVATLSSAVLPGIVPVRDSEFPGTAMDSSTNCSSRSCSSLSAGSGSDKVTWVTATATTASLG